MRGRGPWVVRRLPLVLLVGGALLKAALIAAFRITGGGPTAYRLVIVYDPVSVWLANGTWAWLSTNKGSSPYMYDPIWFDVLLVLGFALQCFLLGMILRAIFTSRTRTR